jgi:phosphoglycolate phosphatase-like HAD superfamily hydrolase
MAMRIFLFDIDGTLLLTGGIGTKSFERAFRETYGFAPDMTCYSPWGATDYEIGRSLLEFHFPQRSVSPEELQTFLDYYLNCFHEALPGDTGFRLMPAARESLAALSQPGESLIGVATGNLSRAGWSKLERGGLRDWVKFGGFAEDGVLRADILRAAQQRSLEIAGRGEHQFWVVGDTPKDIDAARAIGAKVVAVATGKFKHGELEAHKPDLLFHDLRALLADLTVLD